MYLVLEMSSQSLDSFQTLRDEKNHSYGCSHNEVKEAL